MTAVILPVPVREIVAQLLHDSAQGQGEVWRGKGYCSATYILSMHICGLQVSQLTEQQKVLFHTLLRESQVTEISSDQLSDRRGQIQAMLQAVPICRLDCCALWILAWCKLKTGICATLPVCKFMFRTCRCGILCCRAEVFALARKTPLSPFLKPLPAPPVDDEVHALESQVLSCA